MRTCEQVRAGHPDKLCDRIADAILDRILSDGSNGTTPSTIVQSRRAGLEVLAKDETIVLSGEVRAAGSLPLEVDLEGLVRSVVSAVGYDNGPRIRIIDLIGVQQPELQASSDRKGAGDQGIMVGFATTETPELMPLEFSYVTRICQALDRRMGAPGYEWMKPDGKAQVTLNSDLTIRKLVVGIQHATHIHGVTEGARIQQLIAEQLRDDFFPAVLGDVARGADIIVNGTDSFAIGGPAGDAGVVGRKIVCDAYGPGVPVGGGAFSGKDPTKVDRSAAYMARRIARQALVEEATRDTSVTVRIAYAIGQKQPEMLVVATNTGDDLTPWARATFPDLSPPAIAESLDLWHPQAGNWSYQQTASYGHFGREGFPWEAPLPKSASVIRGPIPIDAELWDAGCQVDEVRNHFVIPTARRFIADQQAGRVIDVGCGTGYISRKLAAEQALSRVEWTLLDRNPKMLRFAAGRFPEGRRIAYTSDDAESYSAGHSLRPHDLCLCAYTPLEVENFDLFAEALKRCVPRGTILLFVPDIVPDIIKHYAGRGVQTLSDLPTREVTHRLEKVDGFTGRPQTFLARQTIDYVRPMLDDATALREVLSYATTRGARHFCFVFERQGK
jgi:S-adenosylmethionine synthetase